MNKILVTALGLVFSLNAFGDVVERIVAVVNSEAILESDFKLLKERSKNPMLLNRYLLPEDPSVLAKGDRKVSLDYLIGDKIVDSEIKRLNLSVTTEKVEQEIREIAKRNHMSVEELYQQIKAEGLSKADYQAAMKSTIERQSLLEQEIVSKIRISDEDALAEYLRRHPDAKVSVDEFTVSHILFSPKKGGAEAALKRAQDAQKRLENGENFETLAEQLSEDPNFSAGGLLGTFKSGEFLKEIESAIAPLQPGQTTRVVQSRIGFHIAKLIGKKLAADPKFERERDAIKARLMDAAVQRQFRLWLQTKKDDSFIRINGDKDAKP